MKTTINNNVITPAHDGSIAASITASLTIVDFIVNPCTAFDVVPSVKIFSVIVAVCMDSVAAVLSVSIAVDSPKKSCELLSVDISLDDVAVESTDVSLDVNMESVKNDLDIINICSVTSVTVDYIDCYTGTNNSPFLVCYVVID